MDSSKTFRFFVSSTFSDFKQERKLLQTKVFPHMKDYCYKKGYTFQAIDLRWGISNEAQLDQKTLKLCLDEVRVCKSHPYPNFLVMAGDRYGWVPLPYMIEKEEFETLFELMKKEERQAITEWYQEDLNQIPVSYILKERDGDFVEDKKWTSLENELRLILQGAVQTSSLDDEQRHKYFLSATEAEVEEGIFNYLNPTKFQRESGLDPFLDQEHVFGFIRSVKTENIKGTNAFIGKCYHEAQAFKKRLKQVVFNCFEANPKLLNEENIEEDYLEDFEENIISFLKKSMDAQMQRHQKISALEAEQQTQRYFAQQKCKDFLGQEKVLQVISSYISNDHKSPLIIYGPSGRGKSSVMAKAIEKAEEGLEKKVIYRFVGATPHSSSSKEILTSIFEELGVNVQKEDKKSHKDQISLTMIENQETFEQFSERIYTEIMSVKKNVVIFIDAVDQLDNNDQFLWLPRQLPSNVKIIISALDDENYKEDSRFFNRLKDKTSNLIKIKEFDKAVELITDLLAKEDRKLQRHQEEYFLKQFTKVKSPLYVSVAAQELKNWKSFDVVEEKEIQGSQEKSLASSQKGIIQEFIQNLHKYHHHDAELVRKVLGYFYASRDGLSESELLTLLSQDESFVKKMAPETWHENPTKELPTVIWTRLHAHLRPFLSQKSQDGEALMYFFHREFEDVIKYLPNQEQEHESIIKATQKLILKYQEDDFNSNRWGKVYVALLMEYTFYYDNEEKKIDFFKFIVSLNNEVWTQNFLSNLSSSGYELSLNFRIKKAIICSEIHLSITQELYEVNAGLWAEEYGNAMSDLGLLYFAENRLKEAVELLEKAMQLCEHWHTIDPAYWMQDYVRSQENLGQVFIVQNCLLKAIILLEKALRLCENLYLVDSDYWVADYINAQVNLAYAYYQENRLEEAKLIQKKNMQLCKELFLLNRNRWSKEYVLSLNHLANSFHSEFHFNEANELRKECLQICEEFYIANNNLWVVSYVEVLTNYAETYLMGKRFTEATKFLQKGLKICQKRFLINNNYWAETYIRIRDRLAHLYLIENCFDKSFKLQKENYKIVKTLYESNREHWTYLYIKILNAYSNYFIVESLDNAIELQQESLRLCIDRCVENDYRVISLYVGLEGALENLANSYAKKNCFSEAIELEERRLNECKKLITNNRDLWIENYIQALHNLAYTYSIKEHLNEAIELQKEALLLSGELCEINTGRWKELYDKVDKGYQLIKNQITYHTKKEYARNDPCYCGSEKKYKKCHGK